MTDTTTTIYDNKDIEEKVKKAISEKLSIPEDKITVESKIIDDLGADSLDVVELVMDLEGEFGIEIPDADAEKLATVSDIINYIATHKK